MRFLGSRDDFFTSSFAFTVPSKKKEKKMKEIQYNGINGASQKEKAKDSHIVKILKDF